jgi:hypothetical protein
MYVMYYASMLQYWELIWILVRANHHCLRVGRHSHSSPLGLLAVTNLETLGQG